MLGLEQFVEVFRLISGTHVIEDVEGCEKTNNIVSKQPDFREGTLGTASCEILLVIGAVYTAITFVVS